MLYGSVNGAIWVGKGSDMGFSALLYLKAFKNLKSPTLKKNLWITQFFDMAKIVKIKRYGRPNRAAVIPPESPEGDLGLSKVECHQKSRRLQKAVF